MLAVLGGGQQHFRKLTMSQVYQQVELEEDCKRFTTTLNMPNAIGYFIASALGFIQRDMGNLLKKIPGVNLGGGLMISLSRAKLMMNKYLPTLNKVLQGLEEIGLHLKHNKSFFFLKK